MLPAVAFLLIAIAPPLNHDVAAVLHFTERWLAGEPLYARLVDMNPPLVFVLTLLPAAIGAWTPLDGVQGMVLSVLGLCAISATLALRLLRHRPGSPISRPVEAACLSATIPLLTIAAGYDFGQREHLMVVAAMPYLILAARRIEANTPAGHGAVLGCAILAALGFALKPHFLAVPALVEALVLLRRGRRGQAEAALRDPVPWTMAAVWLLYLAAIPLLFPDYFGQVLPLAWAYYLDIGGFAWWQVLLTERLGTALMLLLPLSILAFRPGGAAPGEAQGDTLPQVVALAALGATIAAVAQQKGWTYHVLPVRLLAGLLAVALAARWLDRSLPLARATRAAPALAAVAAFAVGLHNLAGAEAPWREITWSWSRGGAIAALLQREAYNERLLVLSPDIFPVHPALNYARAWSTLRTMNLWMVQGVYQDCPASGARYREAWEMPRAESLAWRTVAEDFAAAPPAAILVSLNPGIPRCGGRDFDFLEYFSAHPLFAVTLRRYRLSAEVEGYRLYRLEASGRPREK